MERIKLKLRRLAYRIKRWFNQERFIFVVAVLMCLIWTWGAISAMTRNWYLEQRLVSKRQELALLQLEIDALELENRYYASDEYQELVARAKRNKLLDGESLVYLPENSDYARSKHTEIVTTEEETTEEPSNFEQWFSFIFGG
ncbi:hypothetical protein IKW75_02680 [Candidatus Saccharibacteria bacterium]|nr:hypothetical protein [Candidatus Saccharibacteria bacterium]